MDTLDIQFDETTPRADLEEALTHLAAQAHSRMQHVIGTEDHPTRWDRAHKTIDRMLLLLEAR